MRVFSMLVFHPRNFIKITIFNILCLINFEKQAQAQENISIWLSKYKNHIPSDLNPYVHNLLPYTRHRSLPTQLPTTYGCPEEILRRISKVYYNKIIPGIKNQLERDDPYQVQPSNLTYTSCGPSTGFITYSILVNPLNLQGFSQNIQFDYTQSPSSCDAVTVLTIPYMKLNTTVAVGSYSVCGGVDTVPDLVADINIESKPTAAFAVKIPIHLHFSMSSDGGGQVTLTVKERKDVVVNMSPLKVTDLGGYALSGTILSTPALKAYEGKEVYPQIGDHFYQNFKKITFSE